MTDRDSAGAAVGIVGAGIAGLAAAAAVARAGHRVSVYEKSKGLGGRLATRRGPAGDFDHGAPGFTVTTPAFAEAVASAREAGGAVAWPEGTPALLTLGGGGVWTGLPGASGFARAVAGALPATVALSHGVAVTGLARGPAGWHLEGAEARLDAVILAVPAPQAAMLLDAAHPDLAATARRVEMVPVLTAMLGFEGAGPVAPLPDGGDAVIAKAIEHSAKPGRAETPLRRWVVHAGDGWSRERLDWEKDAIAAALADAFSAATGAPRPAHAAGHRWRYAFAAEPLGRAAPGDDDARLALAGDWCLGRTVEDAWRSGTAAGERVVRALA